MALVREFGGQDLRIPKEAGRDTWEAFAEIIGESATKALAAEMGGADVYIALCHNALKRDRNRKMIAKYEKLIKQGLSGRGAVSVLVREFRPISYRQVENIINSPLPSPSSMDHQIALF